MNTGKSPWSDAWPDGLAFLGGLGVAWWAGWNTTDLVWSLWLASLVVGYATIVWMIFRGVRESPAMLVGGLFLLAFFTFHFGLFHFVHSVFLNIFFPIVGDGRGVPGLGLYGEVLGRYWFWLPVALVAERQAFRGPPPLSAKLPEKGRKLNRGDPLMGPYKNVIRMHLLIFFFAFVRFAQVEHFWIYAVVYAVYFFPWRLVKKETVPADA